LSLFAIGTTEFVVVGLLPTLAGSLHVSLSIIGLLVTAYAIGIAAGGLIVTALSARMNRKHLLVALMAVFIAGNLVSAAAQDVQLLIATRLITAVAHAVIASVGAALAISLVDESKQARAISAVFGGLTASLVVGVPLCTCIGQHLGWRAAFLAVAVISALALVGDMLFLPNGPGSPGVPLHRQVARLADKQLVLALVVALLGFGGQILAYTYVTPFLEDVSGFSPSTISLLLLGFGAAAAVGNFIAGPIADRWLGPALLGGTGPSRRHAVGDDRHRPDPLRRGDHPAGVGGGRVRHRADLPELPLSQRSGYPRDGRRSGRELHQRRRRGRFRGLRADRGRLRRPRRHLDRRAGRHCRAGRRRPGAAHRRTQVPCNVTTRPAPTWTPG
jgi:MFS family permease